MKWLSLSKKKILFRISDVNSKFLNEKEAKLSEQAIWPTLHGIKTSPASCETTLKQLFMNYSLYYIDRVCWKETHMGDFITALNKLLPIEQEFT